MKSINYFLKRVKNEFQSFYKDIIPNLKLFKGVEQHIFLSFDTIIKNLIK